VQDRAAATRDPVLLDGSPSGKPTCLEVLELGHVDSEIGTLPAFQINQEIIRIVRPNQDATRRSSGPQGSLSHSLDETAQTGRLQKATRELRPSGL
jgi:hypothetical protein